MLGPVFRTHDPEHERLVAVKVFTLDLTPEQASDLSAEFQRLADLDIDEPSVAAPVAAGIEEFVPYLAAPFVPGESLDAAIRQYGPAPAGDAIRLITHVADALDAAAHVGVFHGSLHPRDVIVTPGETHVTGLGISQGLERVGLHGPIRRPYVAPEREAGDEWGAAADIYSLAVIAYEVLTGRRALPGTDQPLAALSDLRVHDAAALREALESALDTDPERRPAHARDFAAAFAAALSESAGAAPAGERPAERRPRKPRSRPAAKLPGLDEPLTAPVSVTKDRARPAPPSVLPEPAAATPAAAAPPQAASGAGEFRYVPVTDAADAGEGPAAVRPQPEPSPESPAEPEAAAPAAIPGPASPEPVADETAAGQTPDLQLSDRLLPRAELAGESVDAELAAALDLMAPARGAGPTPTSIGIDLFGPTPVPGAPPEVAGRSDTDYDPVAETRLTFDAAAGQKTQEAQPAPVVIPGAQAEAEDFALDLNAPGAPAAAAQPGTGEFDVSAIAAAPPPARAATPLPDETPHAAAEPEPPAAGRGDERRRTPVRQLRVVTPAPAPPAPAEPQAEVPRAFAETRATPPPRQVPDFELLARPESSRPPVFPVMVGVAIGLVLGLAGGYWLGSRNSVPASAPAAQAALSTRPAPVPAAPAAVPPGSAPSPAAETGPAKPSAAPPVKPAEAAPARTAEVTPAAPAPSVAPAAARPAAPAAAIGSIKVTADLQVYVYLDGKRDGLTPRNLKDVPLGSHTIRATRPGYAPQERTVVLTAQNPTASLEFTLGKTAAPAAGASQAPAVKSVLTVYIESTPPGARIRIDGRDLAETPLMVRQMRPGTHRIELRLAGYKTWSTSITVAAGDNRRITAALERNNSR